MKFENKSVQRQNKEVMKHIFLFMAVAILGTSAKAQDLIVTKQGDPVKAWNIGISDKYVFYTTEADEAAPIQRIAKDDILMIRRADGTAETLTATSAPAPAEQKNTIPDSPVIDESDIHGSLIAEGNCVFIPTDSPLEYEKAGQQRLLEFVQKWGYWKVVAKPEQAHFVLQFTTQISGEDLSFLIIRPRKYYASHPTLSRSGWSGAWTNAKGEVGVTANWTKSNEDVGENKLKAELLADHLKQMITVPDNKDGKRFFKYHSKALNADNANNDSSHLCIFVR